MQTYKHILLLLCALHAEELSDLRDTETDSSEI
jgi:hypothetical protein